MSDKFTTLRIRSSVHETIGREAKKFGVSIGAYTEKAISAGIKSLSETGWQRLDSDYCLDREGAAQELIKEGFARAEKDMTELLAWLAGLDNKQRDIIKYHIKEFKIAANKARLARI